MKTLILHLLHWQGGPGSEQFETTEKKSKFISLQQFVWEEPPKMKR
jgi:hypothetical protein